MLEALLKEPGAVVSRERLEDAVYGWGEEVGSNSIEVHVHHLRRKLAPELIRNVRGVSYRIDVSLPRLAAVLGAPAGLGG